MNITHAKFSMIARRRGFVASCAAAAGLVLLSVAAPNIQAQNENEANAFFARAKLKQEQAQQHRAEANAKLQAAAEDDAQAIADERSAQLLVARALGFLKADKEKQRAFQLRNDATHNMAQANRKRVDARNAELACAQHKEEAEQMRKAAVSVSKDQPAVAATLEEYAKAQITQAEQYQQAAAAAKAEASQLDLRAETDWATAEKLDPQTHQKLAAKPAPVVLREVMHK